MSAPDQACRKFQANFFNRSKCQNCFKARDSHPVSDRDRSQAKPIYGGWLLLAPEGISFDNPGQRSRKWQRRFFILYEHGLLCYALDEMPSTLPQGSINMNQSTDVLEGESTTAHKYSLCILTPEKQHFIRAENRETINGWFETLIVYPRANKQNPKKKRKVESPPAQEPGPAKIAVTQCHIPGVEKIPSQKSTLWQKELPETRNHPQHCPQGPAPMAVFPRTPALDEGSGTKGNVAARWPLHQLPATYKPLGSLPGTGTFSRYSCPESGSVAACSPQLSCHPFPPTDRNLSISSSQSSLGSDTSSSSLSSASPLDTLGPGLETRHTDYVTLADIPRVKRNSHREAFRAERQARARSPGREEVIRLFGYERRKSQVIEQFEALQMEASSPGDTKINNETRQGRSETRNFSRKRVRGDRDIGFLFQWKKHWFVLTDRFLRFYRDSVAEEAVDLDGEVDLNGCSEATECEVQRNYGFQINTQAGVCVLSAMTSGIRNSWIQAIMKNVRPVTMPDVASHVSEEKQKARTLFEGSFRMKTKAETGTCVETESKRSRTRERRREGRSKTLDWAEFCRDTKVDLDLSNSSATEPDPRELERDRARRREERRRRFETAEDSHSLHDEPLMKLEVDGSIRTPKAARPENVSVEIEQRWHQVESARLCEENQVPIPIHSTQANGQERLPAQEPQALSTEVRNNADFHPQATCERAFAAMEESHHKVLEDLQRRHQRERETLEREKQQLLAEETAATIAAIEAMKNAHREELEREQGKTQRSQISGMNSDTEALHKQHMEEIESVQRELEVLSEQYSHKCLENAHLAQALEAERQALQQCQRENQELNTHNQDLNKRLAAEFARLRELVTGEGRGDGAGSPSSQGKDGYELEVLLRVKESEIQYLKQEISSVKDELHTALRDKKYSTDKYKDIYTELSIVRAKADCDINRLREQLKEATEALCGGSGHVPVYGKKNTRTRDTVCCSSILMFYKLSSLVTETVLFVLIFHFPQT
uniref:Myosin phosphatase Rho interacting protein n=1 Tax=Callorhinchus milii TaxID=7868 RepID=A0A4W3H7K1_CALMI